MTGNQIDRLGPQSAIRTFIAAKLFQVLPFRLSVLILQVSLKLNMGWAKNAVHAILKIYTGGESLSSANQLIHQLANHEVGGILDYYPSNQPHKGFNEPYLNELSNIVSQPVEIASLRLLVLKLHEIIPHHIMLSARKQPGGKHLLHGDRYNHVLDKISAIIKKGVSSGMQIIIDTGGPHVYPFIQLMGVELMEIYNRSRPVIFCSVPINYPDSLLFLRETTAEAIRKEYIPAFVLMRGGYHNKNSRNDEQKILLQYKEAISFCLENISTVSLIIATHKESIIHYLFSRLEDLGINRSHANVHITQSMGIGDEITFSSAKSGFRALKYIPFGPSDQLLDGLFTRAISNRSIRKHIKDGILHLK